MRRSRSLLSQINTSLQNLEEHSQGRKFSTLQAQNERNGSWGRIWTTGLNGPTSQYCAQRQAVEYLMKFSIRFQNRSSRFWCFTSTLQSEGFSWDGWNSEWIGSSRWPNFQPDNYDSPLLQRICAEFGVLSSAGFKGGDNHGLGTVFIYVSYVGPEADHSLSYPRRQTFRVPS